MKIASKKVIIDSIERGWQQRLIQTEELLLGTTKVPLVEAFILYFVVCDEAFSSDLLYHL